MVDLAKNRLREFRERNELSQKGLAEKVDVTRQTILSIEKGRYIPSLQLALKLAKQFNCKVEDLFDI